MWAPISTSRVAMATKVPLCYSAFYETTGDPFVLHDDIHPGVRSLRGRPAAALRERQARPVERLARHPLVGGAVGRRTRDRRRTDRHLRQPSLGQAAGDRARFA